VFEAIAQEGMGAIVYSPLAQGLLTDRYLKGIPHDSRASSSPFLTPDRISADVMGRVKALNAIAARRGQTLAQLALSWVLRLPVVSSALMGASRTAQVEDAVAALDGPALTAGELQDIESKLASG
jgi:L-glyceraldehyde 3-phosphate reductase